MSTHMRLCIPFLCAISVKCFPSSISCWPIQIRFHQVHLFQFKWSYKLSMTALCSILQFIYLIFDIFCIRCQYNQLFFFSFGNKVSNAGRFLFNDVSMLTTHFSRLVYMLGCILATFYSECRWGTRNTFQQFVEPIYGGHIPAVELYTVPSRPKLCNTWLCVCVCVCGRALWNDII